MTKLDRRTLDVFANLIDRTRSGTMPRYRAKKAGLGIMVTLFGLQCATPGQAQQVSNMQQLIENLDNRPPMEAGRIARGPTPNNLEGREHRQSKPEPDESNGMARPVSKRKIVAVASCSGSPSAARNWAPNYNLAFLPPSLMTLGKGLARHLPTDGNLAVDDRVAANDGDENQYSSQQGQDRAPLERGPVSRGIATEEVEAKQHNRSLGKPSLPNGRALAMNMPGAGGKDAKYGDLPTVDLEVYFKYGSSVITPSAAPKLMTLGKALSEGRLANGPFIIAGHTDAKGAADNNQELSQLRARAVRDYLIANFAIEPSKLIVIGYGKRELKEPRKPFAAINRRVLFNIWANVASR